MLWLEYWSIAYLNSTTSFFQVTRMDPPNRGHVFTLERVTKKKLPKWVTTGAGTLACQIQSFVSAVYGYRNLATRGFQTAGCFGGNSRRSLELIQLSNRNENQIASKPSSPNLPIPSNSPPVIFHSCGYPVTFLRMTFSFFVPSNQHKPRPRTINSRPGWDADKFITAWDVASCVIRKPQGPYTWVLSNNQKGTSFSVAKRCPGKRNHIFKWCASRNCWVSSIPSAIISFFPQILTVQKRDDEHHLSENSVSCFYLWKICPLKSAAPKQISKRTCANCITSTTTIDTCFSPPFHFQSKSRVIWFGNQMERRWTKSKLVLEQSNEHLPRTPW